MMLKARRNEHYCSDKLHGIPVSESRFIGIRQKHHRRIQGCHEACPSTTVALRLLHQRQMPAGDALSTRELEVLTLVARGASNKEIARALHLSESTVKSHLLHLFEKLHVTDRTAAVTVALERGLLCLEL